VIENYDYNSRWIFYCSTLALVGKNCTRHSYENYASNTPKGRQKWIKNLFSKTRISLFFSFFIKLPNRKRKKRSFNKEQNTIKKKSIIIISIYSHEQSSSCILYMGKSSRFNNLSYSYHVVAVASICENSKVCDINFFVLLRFLLFKISTKRNAKDIEFFSITPRLNVRMWQRK
jgi:hypothetical protein